MNDREQSPGFPADPPLAAATEVAGGTTAGAPIPFRELPAGSEVTRLRDLSPEQWKSGAAAWLGWLFDGMDMHLYTLVATPFVAELLAVGPKEEIVRSRSSWIQAAFLLGWALGGGFFGRIGDRIGRSRALMLTILTYAIFTGISYFAQTWWQLFIFRFLAALGIGGEWAVGASLLSETWPRRWRPWIAAVLQTGVNIGILVACVAYWMLARAPNRTVFLVGILPALLVLWIRRAVPEPEEWHAAKLNSTAAEPVIADLFRGSVRRITVLTIVVCGLSLTAHWAFMFWFPQHLRNMPELAAWSDEQRNTFVSGAVMLVMLTSIVGNFLAAGIARLVGYRLAIASLFLAYFCAMMGTYSVPRGYQSLWYCLGVMGLCQGVFALFTMYLPPLFPTLLRTTGAGFSYNIGRVAAAFGTVFFGLFSKVGDFRLALLYAGCLFLPAGAIAFLLPDLSDEAGTAGPTD